MTGRKSQYSEDFKPDVVNYYYLSRDFMNSTAVDLEVSQFSINNWIQSAKSN